MLDAGHSLLLLIDFQARLMPEIEDGTSVLAAAERLARAARLLEVPVLATEENPGSTMSPDDPEPALESAYSSHGSSVVQMRTPGNKHRSKRTRGLGSTVEPLNELADEVLVKMAFDACAEPALPAALGGHDRRIVVAGCETHICVLQTVLGLRAAGREVTLASDAVGSRRTSDKSAALDRMARHGVELVTSEMVLFEWLRSCEHPQFKEVLALVR